MKGLSRRRFLRSAAAAASASCVAPALANAIPTRPASPSASPRGAQAIEDALEILAPTGPEFHGRLANHGPMAAQALVALERPESVVAWVEKYRRRLQPHPPGTRTIKPSGWREALGAGDRVGDWIVFFRRELAERPWRDVLGTWTARLAPGVVAAAFHGAIRTAHAVRNLEQTETPARTRELAEGLGYWAATYNALPEASPRRRAAAGSLPSAAVASVPILPADRRVSYGNIVDRLAPLNAFAPFAAVADSVDASGDAAAFLSNLTETFATVYLASVPPGSVITFLHGVTGPAAVRTLLPYAPPEPRRELLRYTWQACASFLSSSGGNTVPPPSSEKLPSRDELADRALATGDEHAIKFTDACFRENALNPSPVYARAAKDGVARLG
jgi:hypothetical protein